MINKEQQDKLEDLKLQQKQLEESIKNLEFSLKEPAKFLTSQLTDEGERARRKYLGGNVGILCRYYGVADDLDEVFDNPDGDLARYFNNYNDHGYYFLGCSIGWKHARQARPQKGVWYWREDEKDAPPVGSQRVALLRGGRLYVGNTCRLTILNSPSDMIAYMLLD